ncbi:Sodium-Dependent Phosphate Transport Protein 2A [Manis pentadactyla]|nr:Sodium-Dependent Phosphate Transport Protein 2A [Manis pentadactyla]
MCYFVKNMSFVMINIELVLQFSSIILLWIHGNSEQCCENDYNLKSNSTIKLGIEKGNNFMGTGIEHLPLYGKALAWSNILSNEKMGLFEETDIGNNAF